MERRKIITSAGSIGILGLSGCLDVLDDNNPTNNTTDNNNPDDNRGEDSSVSYPDRFDYLFPTESLNDQDGRVSININYESLSSKFSDIYDESFDSVDENSITLHTKSGLNSTRILLETEFENHIASDDILSQINIINESSNLDSIKNYTLLENILICKSDISSSEVSNLWNIDQNTNSGTNSKYDLFGSDEDNFVAIGIDWFAVPVGETTESGFINNINEITNVMSEDGIVSENMYDLEQKRQNNRENIGDVTIGEFGTDLSFIDDKFGYSADGILCSSYISDTSIETITIIKFNSNPDESSIRDNLNSDINNLNVSIEGDTAIIEGYWE